MKKYIVATLCAVAVIISAFIGYQRYKKPLVSVVMLTYKRADIVPVAIESILAQTFKDYEFIILNDGSPDNTDEVIEKYLKQDSRIRYYKNDRNRGIAYSRNRVTALARGKYVMIMDDDDESLPERMQKQVEFLEKNPHITVVSGQIKESIWPEVPNDSNQLAAGLIQLNNIGNANTMYRREFVEEHNITYPNIDYGEDWYFWLEILFSGGKFSSIPDEVVYRRDFSKKHYKPHPEHTYEVINQYVGGFFSPKNPEAFYQADPCGKLRMIAKAPVQIFTEEYMEMLLKTNCSSL